MTAECIRECDAQFDIDGSKPCAFDVMEDFGFYYADRIGSSHEVAKRWTSYRAHPDGTIPRCLQDTRERPAVGQLCQALVQINLPTEEKAPASDIINPILKK